MAILVLAKRSLGLSATRPDLTEYHRGSGDRVRSRGNKNRRGHRLGAPRVAFWHVMTIRRCPAIALHRAIAVSGKVQRGDLKRSVLLRFRSPSQIRVLPPTLGKPEQHSGQYEGGARLHAGGTRSARNPLELRFLQQRGTGCENSAVRNSCARRWPRASLCTYNAFES